MDEQKSPLVRLREEFEQINHALTGLSIDASMPADFGSKTPQEVADELAPLKKRLGKGIRELKAQYDNLDSPFLAKHKLLCINGGRIIKNLEAQYSPRPENDSGP